MVVLCCMMGFCCCGSYLLFVIYNVGIPVPYTHNTYIERQTCIRTVEQQNHHTLLIRETNVVHLCSM